MHNRWDCWDKLLRKGQITRIWGVNGALGRQLANQSYSLEEIYISATCTLSLWQTLVETEAHIKDSRKSPVINVKSSLHNGLGC